MRHHVVRIEDPERLDRVLAGTETVRDVWAT